MNDQEPGQTTNGNQSGDRLRSTIAFPYGSLRDAEVIADVLHQSWGGSASPDQIAGSLNTKPRGGTFRNRLGAARIFGAVNVARGKVTLSDLGHRLVDPSAKKAARVEAFLTVPLFKAIYETYEGKSLPPDGGLEQKIAELGVSVKQTSKARQSMQSSAKRAGFFDTTKGRLVKPPVGSTPGGSSSHQGRDGNGSTSQQTADDPLITLWMTLLDDGGSWSAEETQKFVAAARAMREVMSKSG
jgi:hypothetical protein